MKYFIDTEFQEHKKKILFSKSIDTIDLISIGIVAEDKREYYAICNEFDIKAAWNNKWLRENVIAPIAFEIQSDIYPEVVEDFGNFNNWYGHFTRSRGGVKRLFNIAKKVINEHGKSKEQIAGEIIKFTSKSPFQIIPKEFYAYYADYDWVVFCWLFGRMIDLPKGFPKYCRDLKQMLDEKGNPDFRKAVPKANEHNALADAKWNLKLYNFINRLNN